MSMTELDQLKAQARSTAEQILADIRIQSLMKHKLAPIQQLLDRQLELENALRKAKEALVQSANELESCHRYVRGAQQWIALAPISSAITQAQRALAAITPLIGGQK